MKLRKRESSRKSHRSSVKGFNFESSAEDDISLEDPSSASGDNGFNTQLIEMLRERIEYEPYVPPLIPTTTLAEEGDPTPSITDLIEDENDEIKIIMVRNSVDEKSEQMKRSSSSLKKTTEEKRQLDEEMKKKAEKDGDTKKSVIKKITNSELDYLYDLIIIKEQFFEKIENKILSKEECCEVFSPYNKILELHYRIGNELGKNGEASSCPKGNAMLSLLDIYYTNVEEFSQLYLDLFVKYDKILKIWKQQMHCNQNLREFVEEEEKETECHVEDLFKLPFRKLNVYREHINKLSNWVKKEEDMGKLQCFLAAIRSLQEQQDIFCGSK